MGFGLIKAKSEGREKNTAVGRRLRQLEYTVQARSRRSIQEDHVSETLHQSLIQIAYSGSDNKRGGSADLIRSQNKLPQLCSPESADEASPQSEFIGSAALRIIDMLRCCFPSPPTALAAPRRITVYAAYLCRLGAQVGRVNEGLVIA